jgi:hypothetical protein
MDADLLHWRQSADAWHEVRSSCTYSRSFPSLYGFRGADPKLLGYVLGKLAEPVASVPPQDVYLLRGATVADSTLVFLKSGDLFAPSSIDQAPINLEECVGNFGQTQPAKMPGSYAYIFKAGKNNYGHVLSEMLPRLLNLKKVLGPRFDLLLPTLPSAIKGHVIEAVDAVCPKVRVVDAVAPLVQVDELVYAGPITKHNYLKSETLIEFAQLLAAPRDASATRRAYISRVVERNRPMLNEAEVEDAFSRAGFEIIRSVGGSIREQAALFAEFRTVAGPLGAALTNTVFSPAEASIGMLDPGLHDLFFYDLSCLKSQRFSWAFVCPVDYITPERLHGPFTATIDEVNALIRDMS